MKQSIDTNCKASNAILGIIDNFRCDLTVSVSFRDWMRVSAHLLLLLLLRLGLDATIRIAFAAYISESREMNVESTFKTANRLSE